VFFNFVKIKEDFLMLHDRFEIKETWLNYDDDEQIKAKSRLIKKLIPYDVHSVLDVGCGNGIITNELAINWQVTGLDRSAEALQYLKCDKVQASATDIPFPEKSFDLVLSSEMLEHLSDADLQKAVQELKRVSAKYILVSVPWKEYLPASYTFCPVCKHKFHIWHHYQSFTTKRLQKLFAPEFKPLLNETAGQLQQNWLPFLLKLRQCFGQWMVTNKTTVCPYCGNTDFSSIHFNLGTKLVNGLNHLLAGKHHYWLIMLFGRQ